MGKHNGEITRKPENKAIVIDFETGGIDPYKNGITSISVREVGKINEAETLFIRPKAGKIYSYEAWKVNKISLYDLTGNKEAVSLSTAITHILMNYLNSEIVTLIGHNIDLFDIKFLLQAIKESQASQHLPAIMTIDTMTLAKRHLKDNKLIKSVSLESVTDYLLETSQNIQKSDHVKELERQLTEEVNFHDGHYDCVACEFIYHMLMIQENIEEEQQK